MYKALIIDDEKSVHLVITKLGRWREHGILLPSSAYNGREGLASMRELKPDIVFMDMQMPVMDGIQLLNLASREFPDIKFIIVSGYDDFSYAQIGIKNGAIDYLLKPITEDDLEKSLNKAVSLLNHQYNILPVTPDLETNISSLEIVNMIKEYVEKNYCCDIKISMFSDKYFFSKEYLSKIFKREFGYGIYEYALKLRMARAKELLNDPSVPIKDIAERLGYSNNNYFSKAFKKYYNFSPTDFRHE
ncbi:MAG: response regulator [Anaerocolumna sp.]